MDEQYRSRNEHADRLVQSAISRTIHLENVEASNKKSQLAHFTI